MSSIFLAIPLSSGVATASSSNVPVYYNPMGWNVGESGNNSNANNTIYVTTDPQSYSFPSSYYNATAETSSEGYVMPNFINLTFGNSFGSPSQYYEEYANGQPSAFIINLYPVAAGGDWIKVPISSHTNQPDWSLAYGEVQQKINWSFNASATQNLQSNGFLNNSIFGVNETRAQPYLPPSAFQIAMILAEIAAFGASVYGDLTGWPFEPYTFMEGPLLAGELYSVLSLPYRDGGNYKNTPHVKWLQTVGGTLNGTIENSGTFQGYEDGVNLFGTMPSLSLTAIGYSGGAFSPNDLSITATNVLDNVSYEASSTLHVLARQAVSLGGYVYLPGGKPAANCEVTIGQSTDNFVLQKEYALRTNSQGYWHFFADPGYVYSATASFTSPFGTGASSGLASIPSSYTQMSAAGSVHKSNNIYLSGAYTMWGTVKNVQNGSAIENGTVTATLNGVSVTAVTDASGVYVIGTTQAGEYSLDATASGYQAVLADANVTAAINVSQVNFDTMSGIATVPSNILSYYQIAVTNAQNASTPNQYDQRIVVNSSQFRNLETVNLSNVEFFYRNGTVIDSWLESGNSNESSNTVYWLLLAGIPAHSSTNIYIGFGNKSVSFFGNGKVGEAPELSTFSYGAYDNGAKMFLDYFNGSTSLTNFSNNSALSLTNTSIGYGSGAIRALHLSGVSGQWQLGFVYLKGFQNDPNSTYLVQGNFMNPGVNSEGIDITSSTNSDSAPLVNGVVSANGSSPFYFANEYVDGAGNWQTSNTGGTYQYHGQWIYGSIVLNGSNSSLSGFNSPELYSTVGSYWGSMPNEVGSSNKLYIGSFFADHDNKKADAYFNWVRVILAPPNDVMPSVVGPTAILGWVHLAAVNYQNSPTPNPFQLKVDFNASAYSSIESPGLTNLEFIWGNGTVIPSWLESGTSTSNDAVFWLNVGQIGAYSHIDFYAVIVDENYSLMNGVTVGEAPQLSATYGANDNGQFVFPVYFSGNTPISDFAIESSLNLTHSTASYGGYSINVLKLTRSDYIRAGAFVYLQGISTSNIAGIVSEFNFQNVGTNSEGGDIMSTTSMTSVSSDIGTVTADGGSYFQNQYVSGGTWSTANPAGSGNGNWLYGSNQFVKSSSSFYSYIAPQLYSTSGGYSNTANVNPISGASTLYIGSYFADADGVGANLLINWMRARYYAPNGVMPTVYTYGNMSFHESGLGGQSWSVYLTGILGSATHSSSSNYVTFDGAGQYSYTVSAPSGYVAYPSTGTATINGPDSPTVNLTFVPGTVIQGYVYSNQGGTISGAEVTASNSTAYKQATTNGQGYYSMTVAANGSYGMSAAAIYYDTYTGGNVNAPPGWWNVTLTYNHNNGCVLYGTNITLGNGTQMQVQDITQGTHVLSYNVSNQSVYQGTVFQITISTVSQVWSINGILSVSGVTDQPLYVQLANGTKEWLFLGELNTTMKIYCPQNNTWIQITSITILQGTFTVYDLSVAPVLHNNIAIGGNYIANGILMDDKIA